MKGENNNQTHEFLSQGLRVEKRRSTTERVKQEGNGREERKEGKGSTHQTTPKDFPNIFKRSNDIPQLRARIPSLHELTLQAIEHMIEREPTATSFRSPRRVQRGAEAA